MCIMPGLSSRDCKHFTFRSMVRVLSQVQAWLDSLHHRYPPVDPGGRSPDSMLRPVMSSPRPNRSS